jgi:hypothetical protein
VELRADISDRQSFLGFLGRSPRYQTGFTAYQIGFALWRAHGRPGHWQRPHLVAKGLTFTANALPPVSDYLLVYGPGTIKPLRMSTCIAGASWCGGHFIYRPFSPVPANEEEYWNTRAVANGRYWITVYAWDITGNLVQRTVMVNVEHRPGRWGPLFVAPDVCPLQPG